MKGFFEYIGMADTERVHSQMLAWILSPDCNYLSGRGKLQLVNSIVGGALNSNSIERVFTEHHRIDVLIEMEAYVVVIENKLKSSQHSNQLSTYQEIVSHTLPDKEAKFIYMTLIEEPSNNSHWRNFSYTELVYALENCEKSNRDMYYEDFVIVGQYINTVKRLLLALSRFLETPSEFSNVFIEGHLSKHEKSSREKLADSQQYIRDNQLETIFQKAYFRKIVSELSSLWPNYFFSVNETRGVAIIDAFSKDVYHYKGGDYRIGFQYQGNLIKFAFAATYETYGSSKKESIVEIINFLNGIKGNAQGYSQLNKPKSRAWVSLSKRNPSQLSEITSDVFSQLINSELANIDLLKIQLVKQLNLTLKPLPTN